MKLILAFAAGVVFTSLAFVLFEEATITRPAQEGGIAPLSSSASESERDNTSMSRATTPVNRSSEGDSGGVELPSELIRFALESEQLMMSGDRFRMNNRYQDEQDLMRSWSDEELTAMVEHARGTARSQEVLDAQRVLGPLENELRRRQQIEEWANSPPDDPIYLPPEFDALMENFVLRNQHEILQRDLVDPTWSNSMETNFQEFFETRPEIADTYGTPTITCRAAGCEITLLTYGIDAAVLASEHEIPDSTPAEAVNYDFNVAISGWGEQPWAREFTRVYPPGIRVENGATTIYWPLGR